MFFDKVCSKISAYRVNKLGNPILFKVASYGERKIYEETQIGNITFTRSTVGRKDRVIRGWSYRRVSYYFSGLYRDTSTFCAHDRTVHGTENIFVVKLDVSSSNGEDAECVFSWEVKIRGTNRVLEEGKGRASTEDLFMLSLKYGESGFFSIPHNFNVEDVKEIFPTDIPTPTELEYMTGFSREDITTRYCP